MKTMTIIDPTCWPVELTIRHWMRVDELGAIWYLDEHAWLPDNYELLLGALERG